ncbi:hypothetical protein [Streptomyces sp. 058-1L]
MTVNVFLNTTFEPRSDKREKVMAAIATIAAAIISGGAIIAAPFISGLFG